MAVTDIGARITLKGGADYRRELSQIEAGQKLMRAEMARATAEYKAQDESTDALKRQMHALIDVINGERDRIETLRGAVNQAAAAYGEADTRTIKWREQLVKAQTDVAEMKTKLAGMKEELDNRRQMEQFTAAVKDQTAAIEASDRAEELLRAEMKLIDAQYSATGGAADTLRKKQQNLTNQIEVGEQKVRALRSALKEAEERFGANSKEANAWRIQLYEAETQLTKTKGELEKTGGELDEFGEKLKGRGWGDAIDGLAQKFGVHLPNGIRNALNALGDFDIGTTLAVGGVTALVGALVKAETALWNLTKEAASNADQISTLSVKTGISTDQLQEYAYAAERLDVDLNTITTSHTRLVRAMEQARLGSEQQLAAFYRLGIQFDDSEGNLRDVHEVYWEIIDALGEMTNETDRDATAMELLGRNAQDLNPLIEKGADYMKALAQEAHDVGYVLSEEDVEALAKVDDQFDKLNKKIDTVKNQMALKFAPSMEDVVTKLGEAAEVGGQALTDSGIVEALGHIVEDISGVLDQKDDITGMASDVNTSLRPVAETLLVIYTAIEGIGAIVDGAKGIADKINTAFKSGDLLGGLTAWNPLGGGDISDKTPIWEWLSGTAWGKWKTEMQEKDAAAAAKAAEEAAAAAAQAEAHERVISQGLYIRRTEEETSSSAGMSLREQMNAAASAPFAEEIADEAASRVLPPLKRITDPDMVAYNAGGAGNWRGGVTWVGENGPERVYLPAGSRIDTAQASRGGGDTVIYVTIDAKNVREFNDVVRAAENARMELRRRTG